MLRNPEDLLKDFGEISSLPIVYQKINEAVEKPRSSIADIGKIISEDPGLTARLLRLVNSAFYRFPSKIETITQALVIIGTNQLRDLALATSIVSLFKGIPKDLVDMESFWRHSIACGTAAKIIAIHRREANIERFMIAGMLHDIGRLVLYKKMSEEIREAILRCQSEKTLLFLAEREFIGFDHARLGGLLLRSWNLSENLEETVAFHHQPKEAKHYPVQTAIVHVADIIVNALQWGSSGERDVPPLEEEAWEVIGLPVSILPSVLDHLRNQVKDVVHSVFTGSVS